jgi:chromate reductase, NAD(P)H dehydrogenase (quinone)
MSSISGMSGSLRDASFNRMLLRAAVELAPRGAAIEPESIREIPLYDGDVEEQQGLPSAVQRLKNRIAEADGLLIVTPEYNNSIPGVLKNAIDCYHVRRQTSRASFMGARVAIMGATPGRAFVEGFAAFVERQSDRQSPTAVAQEVIAKGR